MKKIILLTSLILFGLLFAETASFRNLATGTAIDDDLDLIYDPINLNFVSGSRLYTNLSNIINSGERILDNNSLDQYLIGFSVQNPFVENLKHSILIEFANSKYASTKPSVVSSPYVSRMCCNTSINPTSFASHHGLNLSIKYS